MGALSSMTPREQMLTVLRGGEADRIPWNIYAWLLPDLPVSSLLKRKGLGLMGATRIWRRCTVMSPFRRTAKLSAIGRTFGHESIRPLAV